MSTTPKKTFTNDFGGIENSNFQLVNELGNENKEILSQSNTGKNTSPPDKSKSKSEPESQPQSEPQSQSQPPAHPPPPPPEAPALEEKEEKAIEDVDQLANRVKQDLLDQLALDNINNNNNTNNVIVEKKEERLEKGPPCVVLSSNPPLLNLTSLGSAEGGNGGHGGGGGQAAHVELEGHKELNVEIEGQEPGKLGTCDIEEEDSDIENNYRGEELNKTSSLKTKQTQKMASNGGNNNKNNNGSGGPNVGFDMNVSESQSQSQSERQGSGQGQTVTVIAGPHDQETESARERDRQGAADAENNEEKDNNNIKSKNGSLDIGLSSEQLKILSEFEGKTGVNVYSFLKRQMAIASDGTPGGKGDELSTIATLREKEKKDKKGNENGNGNNKSENMNDSGREKEKETEKEIEREVETQTEIEKQRREVTDNDMVVNNNNNNNCNNSMNESDSKGTVEKERRERQGNYKAACLEKKENNGINNGMKYFELNYFENSGNTFIVGDDYYKFTLNMIDKYKKDANSIACTSWYNFDVNDDSHIKEHDKKYAIEKKEIKKRGITPLSRININELKNIFSHADTIIICSSVFFAGPRTLGRLFGQIKKLFDRRKNSIICIEAPIGTYVDCSGNYGKIEYFTALNVFKMVESLDERYDLEYCVELEDDVKDIELARDYGKYIHLGEKYGELERLKMGYYAMNQICTFGNSNNNGEFGASSRMKNERRRGASRTSTRTRMTRRRNVLTKKNMDRSRNQANVGRQVLAQFGGHGAFNDNDNNYNKNGNHMHNGNNNNNGNDNGFDVYQQQPRMRERTESRARRGQGVYPVDRHRNDYPPRGGLNDGENYTRYIEEQDGGQGDDHVPRDNVINDNGDGIRSMDIRSDDESTFDSIGDINSKMRSIGRFASEYNDGRNMRNRRMLGGGGSRNENNNRNDNSVGNINTGIRAYADNRDKRDRRDEDSHDNSNSNSNRNSNYNNNNNNNNNNSNRRSMRRYNKFDLLSNRGNENGNYNGNDNSGVGGSRNVGGFGFGFGFGSGYNDNGNYNGDDNSGSVSGVGGFGFGVGFGSGSPSQVQWQVSRAREQGHGNGGMEMRRMVNRKFGGDGRGSDKIRSNGSQNGKNGKNGNNKRTMFGSPNGGNHSDIRLFFDKEHPPARQLSQNGFGNGSGNNSNGNNNRNNNRNRRDTRRENKFGKRGYGVFSNAGNDEDSDSDNDNENGNGNSNYNSNYSGVNSISGIGGVGAVTDAQRQGSPHSTKKRRLPRKPKSKLGYDDDSDGSNDNNDEWFTMFGNNKNKNNNNNSNNNDSKNIRNNRNNDDSNGSNYGFGFGFGFEESGVSEDGDGQFSFGNENTENRKRNRNRNEDGRNMDPMSFDSSQGRNGYFLQRESKGNGKSWDSACADSDDESNDDIDNDNDE